MTCRSNSEIMEDNEKKTILVVDDEEVIRDFLFEVLNDDFAISFACDGDEAIEKIGAQEYDLIITDLKMPKVSGEEVVAYVSKQNYNTPVIIISGYSSLYAISNSVNSGACAFLSKPFSISTLLETISDCLKS